MKVKIFFFGFLNYPTSINFQKPRIEWRRKIWYAMASGCAKRGGCPSDYVAVSIAAICFLVYVLFLLLLLLEMVCLLTLYFGRLQLESIDFSRYYFWVEPLNVRVMSLAYLLICLLSVWCYDSTELLCLYDPKDLSFAGKLDVPDFLIARFKYLCIMILIWSLEASFSVSESFIVIIFNFLSLIWFTCLLPGFYHGRSYHF